MDDMKRDYLYGQQIKAAELRANSMLASGTTMNAAMSMQGTTYNPLRPKYRVTTINVVQVENGKEVIVGERRYIVPEGSSVLEIIGHALVEAKLEE
jgi:hypothetical protein